MTAAERVAQVYERLVGERATRAGEWTRAERAIWQIVSVRTQKDFGGIASVFTDVEVDWREFTASLEVLGEKDLAAAFEPSVKWASLEALDRVVGDRLWELDGKLAALLDSEAGV